MTAEGPGFGRRASRGVLGATLVVAPLLVGSVHPLVVGALAAALCLAACLALSTPKGTASFPRGRIGLVFAASVLWTAVQLVPVPASLLRRISQRAWAIRIDGPLAPGGSWAPLTLDRSATAGALALAIGLCAAYVCVRHAWRPGDLRSPRGPLRWVAIASLSAAVAAIAHRVVGAQRVFGVYRPIAEHATLASLPIVNPNHLAALTNLGALSCFGLALDESRRELRAAWLGAAAFCAITTLLTLSRGGIVALVVGAAFLLLRLRLGRGPVLKIAIAVTAVVASIGVYLAQGRLRTEVATLLHLGPTAETGRLSLLRDASRMALAFSGTGAGRGCFRLGFPPFDRGGPWAFSHPENLPLQLATEWGMPFAIVFLLVCAAAWLRAAKRPSGGATRSAALAGVLVVVLQNLVDFSLEIAAVALPAVVCFAMVVTPRSEGKSARTAIESRSVSIAWLLAGAVALLAGFFAAERGHEAEGRRLSRMASAGQSPGSISARGRAAMRAHPADAYLPIQVARGLIRTRPRTALRYLNRALWLDPRSGPAHLLTGRALLRLGRAGQAVLHYRAAVRWDPVESRTVAREVASLVRDRNLVLRLVPAGDGGLAVLRALAEAYLEREDLETALDLARVLLRRSGSGSIESAFLARVLVGAGRPLEALPLARSTRGKDGQCEAALWESVAFDALDRHSEGREVLRWAARECPDEPRLRERLVLVAIEARDFRTAEQALAMYRGVVGATDEALAQGYYLEGLLETARHMEARAAAAFQLAAELAPDRPVYLVSARDAWERIGRTDRAEPLRRALSRLQR